MNISINISGSGSYSVNVCNNAFKDTFKYVGSGMDPYSINIPNTPTGNLTNGKTFKGYRTTNAKFLASRK